MPEYYEVHIIQEDGTPWCGHTGATKEEAIKQAREAIDQTIPPIKPLRMEIFACTLVDSIALNHRRIWQGGHRAVL